jgi:hypothetical protein
VLNRKALKKTLREPRHFKPFQHSTKRVERIAIPSHFALRVLFQLAAIMIEVLAGVFSIQGIGPILELIPVLFPLSFDERVSGT